MSLVTTHRTKLLIPHAVYLPMGDEPTVAVAVMGVETRVMVVESQAVVSRLEDSGAVDLHMSVAHAEALYESLGKALVRARQEVAA